ncbi:ABC transporter substrate-binding protein [Tengunoibacter tsumagoiensis]|uniref:Sugar ABC transporter substrate-binding protein n=1 Tax=Tengunoibacter tsumagoiensis TaxID=2014871 RepID=A0A401ZV31_9CHLR|nr:extracellular solute-binding protein [Tengunoibacter tsumagoiensis]GCE10769.1 hypothetical protein KTT_06280 [Tengunoibacter tsumagoiensis]
MYFKNTMNRRRFIQSASAAAGLATLPGLLDACGSQDAAGTVTLKYWDFYVTQAPWIDNEIKLFQQAHPGIKIKKSTQSVGDYANLYSLAVRSNNTPDIAMIPQTPVFNDQVAKGWWQPLDKWADDKWRSRFIPNTLHEGSNIFNGKLYSVPLEGLAVPFQLYINHSVFRAADLVNADGTIMIPRTWDDVTHASEAITKKSGGQVYGLGFGNSAYDVLSWWMFVFIIGAGCPGGPGDPDLRTGKYAFHSNRNYADWLNLLKEWKDRQYIYPDSISISDEVARAYFERGKFGMTIGGIWDQPEWTSHQFTDYSLTTLITPNKEPDSYFPIKPGGTFTAISSKSKHQDEAWAWFDWLASVDAGKRWVEMGEGLSIFPQNNDPKNNSQPHFKQYIDTAKFSVPGPDPTIRNPNVGLVVPQTVKPAMGDIIAGYYTGQISNISDALQELEQKSQKALEDAIAVTNQQGHKVSIDDYIFTDWDVKKPYVTKPNKA